MTEPPQKVLEDSTSNEKGNRVGNNNDEVNEHQKGNQHGTPGRELHGSLALQTTILSRHSIGSSVGLGLEGTF